MGRWCEMPRVIIPRRTEGPQFGGDRTLNPAKPAATKGPIGVARASQSPLRTPNRERNRWRGPRPGEPAPQATANAELVGRASLNFDSAQYRN